MQRYLKVKIKSLAAEAKIIRSEERKVLEYSRHCVQGREAEQLEHLSCYVGLRKHRTCEVRNEARISFLAYSFIRGGKIQDVERSVPPGWLKESAARLIAKYGPWSKKVEWAENYEHWLRSGPCEPGELREV